jgi:hypothetical protein
MKDRAMGLLSFSGRLLVRKTKCGELCHFDFDLRETVFLNMNI